MNIKRKRVCIAILCGCACIYYSVDIGSYILELAQDPKQFKQWIESYGIFAQVIMMALLYLQVIFAWLPGELFEIGAGYAFGFWQGTILVLFASLCASACVMMLVKHYGNKFLSYFFSSSKISDMAFLKDTKRIHRCITIAFLLPGSPKDMLTYAVGFTNMKVSHFLCVSTLARIPSVITSTFTGSALGIENYQLASASFLFTIVTSCLGIWLYRQVGRFTPLQIGGKMQK